MERSKNLHSTAQIITADINQPIFTILISFLLNSCECKQKRMTEEFQILANLHQIQYILLTERSYRFFLAKFAVFVIFA